MKTCTIEGCNRRVLARGFCAPHYSTWHRAQRKYTVTCPQCGKTTRVERAGNKYCSRRCSAINAVIASGRKPLNKQLVVYTGPAFTRPAIHVKTKNRLTSGQCRVCMTWFISTHADVTCSPECSAAHQAQRTHIKMHRRRARKSQAYVSDVRRAEVFLRDGWRCHLCRKRIDPALLYPHPMSASIDHIIPLACGGTHEPSNVRAAHWICNSTKSDRGGGEQLLLIG